MEQIEKLANLLLDDAAIEAVQKQMEIEDEAERQYEAGLKEWKEAQK